MLIILLMLIQLILEFHSIYSAFQGSMSSPFENVQSTWSLSRFIIKEEACNGGQSMWCSIDGLQWVSRGGWGAHVGTRDRFKQNGTTSKDQFCIVLNLNIVLFLLPLILPPLNKYSFRYCFNITTHYWALLCHLIIYLHINALNIYNIFLFSQWKNRPSPPFSIWICCRFKQKAVTLHILTFYFYSVIH